MERNCEACEKYVTSENGKAKGCSQWYCDKFTVTTEECINTFEGMKRGVFPWVMDPYCDKAISALKKNKGEWISEYDEDGKTGWYECSCCHSERAFNTNFCPDCGADMRGKAE